MTTSATSTRFPVGATPGSIQSISTVWVKRTTISSTSWSVPMVRDSGVISMSGGIFGAVGTTAAVLDALSVPAQRGAQ